MNFLQRFKLRSLKKKAEVLFKKRDSGAGDVKQEIKIHKDLAEFYDKHQFDKKLPYAPQSALEHYRIAAILGSSEAQYIFAKRKLEEGKYWDEWIEGIYGRTIHKTYAKACYEEAFNYLSEAEKNSYPLAKRLHGLAYIHGWGIEKNKDEGFKLIVASIEEENAWDKATQIFEELGLNTPEFFSSIMALKQKK